MSQSGRQPGGRAPSAGSPRVPTETPAPEPPGAGEIHDTDDLALSRSDRVGGDYQVRSVWFQGSQLRVYRVSSLSRRGSFLLSELVQPELQPERAARILALRQNPVRALEHPSILPLVEVIDDPERGPLWVEEAPSGGTLRQLLAHRNEPLSGDTAARVLKPIAAAVAHLKRHGLQLYSLNPDRILFTPEGLPCLDASSVLLGDLYPLVDEDPHFVAPEVLAGGPPTELSMLWSLGACLQYAVLGPESWRLSPASLPLGLVPIIAKSWDHRPEERYASLTAFIEALDAVIRPTESRRQGFLAIGFALAVLAVLLLGVSFWIFAPKKPVSARIGKPAAVAEPALVDLRERDPQAQDAAPKTASPKTESPKAEAAAKPEIQAKTEAKTGAKTEAKSERERQAEAARTKKQLHRSLRIAMRKKDWVKASLTARRILKISPTDRVALKARSRAEAQPRFLKWRQAQRRILLSARELTPKALRALHYLEQVIPDSAVVRHWQKQRDLQDQP